MKKLNEIPAELFQNPKKPSIDLEALKLLDQVDPDPENPSLVQEVITLFLREANLLVLKIQAPQTKETLNQTAESAHSLKSSSASVGALRMSQLVQEIESEARKGELQAMPTLLKKLSSEWEVVQKDLHALINS